MKLSEKLILAKSKIDIPENWCQGALATDAKGNVAFTGALGTRNQMMGNWIKWFALYPVKTMGGNRVWLRYVERRWNNELNFWCSDTGYSGSDGGYEYRLPLIGIEYEKTCNYIIQK